MRVSKRDTLSPETISMRWTRPAGGNRDRWVLRRCRVLTRALPGMAGCGVLRPRRIRWRQAGDRVGARRATARQAVRAKGCRVGCCRASDGSASQPRILCGTSPKTCHHLSSVTRAWTEPSRETREQRKTRHHASSRHQPGCSEPLMRDTGAAKNASPRVTRHHQRAANPSCETRKQRKTRHPAFAREASGGWPSEARQGDLSAEAQRAKAEGGLMHGRAPAGRHASSRHQPGCSEPLG